LGQPQKKRNALVTNRMLQMEYEKRAKRLGAEKKGGGTIKKAEKKGRA